jgi:endonuclease YncB( thermonuclease family)
MFRYIRLCSFDWRGQRALAGVTFVFGLLGGAAISTAFTERHGAPAIASPAAPPAARSAPTTLGRYAVDVVRVIDGDTFDARVHVWPGFELSTRVRLRGIDAPEMKARCGDERERADNARALLQTMLAQREVTIWNIGPDKYSGRVVAEAATRQIESISAALLAKGVVRRYEGGRRDGWCDVTASR